MYLMTEKSIISSWCFHVETLWFLCLCFYYSKQIRFKNQASCELLELCLENSIARIRLKMQELILVYKKQAFASYSRPLSSVIVAPFRKCNNGFPFEKSIKTSYFPFSFFSILTIHISVLTYVQNFKFLAQFKRALDRRITFTAPKNEHPIHPIQNRVKKQSLIWLCSRNFSSDKIRYLRWSFKNSIEDLYFYLRKVLWIIPLPYVLPFLFLLLSLLRYLNR